MFRRTLLLSMPALFAGIGFAPPARAATAASPEAFITALAKDALKTLNERLPESEIEKRFQVLLERDFDLPRIGRFVLGRYWNGASDVEKQQFAKLFEDYVVRSYSLRFSEYSGQTVKVLGARPQSADNSVVASLIVPPDGGATTKVDWIVSKKGDDYRIIDVNVEGVSMSMTHRQEFATVIERTGGGVTALNKALEQKLSGASTAQQ
ncbi:MAG TPA: ABC transporter substrate-binding protein [Stellaceae bacterium]|nr:ABC transporter substrate-binding protein [Stellaceae bacterium]